VAAENKVKMKILEDGTISVETDSFEAGTVHMQADQLIKDTVKLTGGKQELVSKKPHKHDHSHVVITNEQKA
jgi:hypothetical protein